MRVQIEAARWLTYRPPSRSEMPGIRISKESSMAKVFATEMRHVVAARAVAILEANGYSREYRSNSYYRDARVTTIYEGRASPANRDLEEHTGGKMSDPENGAPPPGPRAGGGARTHPVRSGGSVRPPFVAPDLSCCVPRLAGARRFSRSASSLRTSRTLRAAGARAGPTMSSAPSSCLRTATSSRRPSPATSGSVLLRARSRGPLLPAGLSPVEDAVRGT